VTYGYISEIFAYWYSGDVYEIGQTKARFSGPMSPLFWLLILCNCLVVQTFWWKRARTSVAWLFIAAIIINCGMWLERFVIIVISLHRDVIPARWMMYMPTWVDLSLFAGTLGLFGTLFLLFLRFVPAVAISEVKEQEHAEHEGHA
jgi:molybdopterin-containing oxidoreductase family membrane subunit